MARKTTKKKTTKKVTKKTSKKKAKKVAKKTTKKALKKTTTNKKATTSKSSKSNVDSRLSKIESHIQELFSGVSKTNELLNTICDHLSKDEKLWPKERTLVNQPETPEEQQEPEADMTQTDMFDPFASDDTPSSDPEWTQGDVMDRLQEVAAQTNIDDVKKILKKFKAQRVSDISESDYDAVMTACNKILN